MPSLCSSLLVELNATLIDWTVYLDLIHFAPLPDVVQIIYSLWMTLVAQVNKLIRGMS